MHSGGLVDTLSHSPSREPSEHGQTVAVAYHVERMHARWPVSEVPEHKMLLIHRMKPAPRGSFRVVTISSDQDR
jgi:hypothetical protein